MSYYRAGGLASLKESHHRAAIGLEDWPLASLKESHHRAVIGLKDGPASRSPIIELL